MSLYLIVINECDSDPHFETVKLANADKLKDVSKVPVSLPCSLCHCALQVSTLHVSWFIHRRRHFHKDERTKRYFVYFTHAFTLFHPGPRTQSQLSSQTVGARHRCMMHAFINACVRVCVCVCVCVFLSVCVCARTA